MPSTVHFSWSPAFSHTTVVLLPAPSPKVDLLSFSFHVPSVGLFAKHIAAAATESSTLKPIVFVLINISFLIHEKHLVCMSGPCPNVFDRDGQRSMLLPPNRLRNRMLACWALGPVSP